MDLQQRKLTKDEWESIEKPVTTDELRIINMIASGYDKVNIKQNNTPTILQILKVKNSENIDKYIFTKYLQKEFKKAIKASKKTPIQYTDVDEKHIIVKKCDLMRFSHTDSSLPSVRDSLFEFVMIDLLAATLKSRNKKGPWHVGYYTLVVMSGYSVDNFNVILRKKISGVLDILSQNIDFVNLIYNGQEIIEHNRLLLKYADEELYHHQKQLLTIFKNSKTPQMVLYIAPTGTGKTMSPIGLLGGKKVIFVCAARHVGLALAKAAISASRKVAFAFGCGDAEDIRLHYSAAKDFVKNRKTGGIFKVDNSIGDNVELMICDIKSYIPAMLYMCAFNNPNDMVTYWDEPTITMDYEEHECHDMIKRNWDENKIPNIVLSSATLPQEQEMTETIMDFRARFEDADVTSIVSHDCKKTIPLLNRKGFIEMPHYLFGDDYNEVLKCVLHCKNYKTLLRYIDLGEAIKFIKIVNEEYCDAIIETRYKLRECFKEIHDVNMTSIKTYYLDLLESINPTEWKNIYKRIIGTRVKTHTSTAYITTHDSHTLTDGPTIYLAEDVDKIARFCLQSADIPSSVLEIIEKTMLYNSVVNEKIIVLTKSLEDKTSADEEKTNKISSDTRTSPEVKVLRKKILELNSCIKTVALPEKHIPNKSEHISKFAPRGEHKRVFKPSITQTDVERIMLIGDIDDMWKLLLMMGIGVFTSHDSIRYTEIMKQLAQEQKLYMIIASTDYIYGTNYQFCHGYIGKDLISMSQEKAIQAMGRVGRNKLQFDYSLRFRDDDILKKLFTHDNNKPEVANMARLFNSD
tara:strand:+ start:671 stop:3076 length:2406 start_codon:yes stop_codon:yes gene_type:complete